MQILEDIGEGDIGAMVGCKNVRSGDTIVGERDSLVKLSGVEMPPPVFFCSIEADMSRDQKELEKILFFMSREDPSLQVKEDEETNQVLVSGLGELHLEVLRDRIEIEYGIKSTLGRMRVAYRESISETQTIEQTFEKTIGGAHMYAKLTLRVESMNDEVDVAEIQRAKFERSMDETDGSALKSQNDSFSLGESGDMTENINVTGQNEVVFDFEDLEPVTERVKLEGDEYEKSKKWKNKDEATNTATMEIYRSLDSLPIEHKLAMRESLDDALQCGTLLGYPMVNTRVRILDGRWSNIRSKNSLVF